MEAIYRFLGVPTAVKFYKKFLLKKQLTEPPYFKYKEGFRYE